MLQRMKSAMRSRAILEYPPNDDGKEHDRQRPRQIRLHFSGLERAEEESNDLRNAGNEVHQAINDVFIDPTTDLRNDDGHLCSTIDDAIDDGSIEPGTRAGKREERANNGKLIELVKVPLIQTKIVERLDSISDLIRKMLALHVHEVRKTDAK